MRVLVVESGIFHTQLAGAWTRRGIFCISLPQYAPDRVIELLEWVKTRDMHMPIRSCAFHYELELIHPFADGNGRIGRLWRTLLLSKWNPSFAWFPVESTLHDRQQAYYAPLNAAYDAGVFSILMASCCLGFLDNLKIFMIQFEEISFFQESFWAVVHIY